MGHSYKDVAGLHITHATRIFFGWAAHHARNQKSHEFRRDFRVDGKLLLDGSRSIEIRPIREFAGKFFVVLLLLLILIKFAAYYLS